MQSKKRVLIISYYFAPQNTIGAVRPTKLAKYLARMGWDVTVICGAGMNDAVDPTLKRDLQALSDVHMIREFNPLRAYKARKQKNATAAVAPPTTASPTVAVPNATPATAAAKPTQGNGLLHRVMNAVYLYLWVLSDRSFQRRAKRELSNLKGHYDAVFSSYAPLSVHNVAFEAKRRGLAQRWVADFRDEVNMSFAWQEKERQRYLRMVKENADVISAVSVGFLAMMGLSAMGRVLSNGFDREDHVGLKPAEPQKRSFRAVYCGQLREGRINVPDRDIRPFFRILRSLINEGELHEDELRLVYAGDESDTFAVYAAECGLSGCVENHGRVSRAESLALQAGADILLMASWNLKGQTGILTGKLFEYMMMDKPIICCMAGNLADSELARVLKTTGMGYCYEEARAQEDAQALQQYLRSLILCWRQDKPLLLSKKGERVDKYAYPHIAAALSVWLEGEK